MPEQFDICSVFVRGEQRAGEFARIHKVPSVWDMDQFLDTRPDFVVVCVRSEFIKSYLELLFEKGIPVLCETPPARTMEQLDEIWELVHRYDCRIQVAEQYFVQPVYAAWYQAVCDGVIGKVSNMTLSALHGYHGASILRRFLDTGYEKCVITGKSFRFPVTETDSREGFIREGEVVLKERRHLTLEFESGKVGFFDFSDVQYHTFIRTRQLNVQGSRGEIDDFTIRYLLTDNRPCTQVLNRYNRGEFNNQEWSLLNLTLGEKLMYQNPTYPARLNDDEIAVAVCLLKMADYVVEGTVFYSMNEALQDAYLSVLMEEALKEPWKSVTSERKPWISNP